MFEHWRQRAYFDNESSVFPDDELLDHLEVHDSHPRRVVANALRNFADDFNSLLLANRIYDWFHYNDYNRVRLKGESVLFS